MLRMLLVMGLTMTALGFGFASSPAEALPLCVETGGTLHCFQCDSWNYPASGSYYQDCEKGTGACVKVGGVADCASTSDYPVLGGYAGTTIDSESECQSVDANYYLVQAEVCSSQT